jgi:hypothetical protein
VGKMFWGNLSDMLSFYGLMVNVGLCVALCRL